jgi:hypothetical protein
MFHVVSSIPWLYVALRTILPLPWHGGIKVAVAIALLAAAQFPLWSRLSSGSVFAPEYPRWLIILLNWDVRRHRFIGGLPAGDRSRDARVSAVACP